jgi:hypothetical protein
MIDCSDLINELVYVRKGLSNEDILFITPVNPRLDAISFHVKLRRTHNSKLYHTARLTTFFIMTENILEQIEANPEMIMKILIEDYKL